MNKCICYFALALAISVVNLGARAQEINPAPGWLGIHLIDESPTAGQNVGDILVQPGRDVLTPNNLPDHAWLKPAAIIDSSMVTSAEPSNPIGTPAIRLELTPEGERRFTDATERNIGKSFGVVLGGHLVEIFIDQYATTNGSLVIVPPGGGLRLDPQGTLPIRHQPASKESEIGYSISSARPLGRGRRLLLSVFRQPTRRRHPRPCA
jgi:hypothetical protein